MLTNRIATFTRVTRPDVLSLPVENATPLLEADGARGVANRLKAGDRVRVTSGNLTDVEGTVVASRRPHRLVVAVSLVQHGVSLEIDEHLVERV